MKQKQIVCVLALIVLLLLSCNLSAVAPASQVTSTSTTDPQVLIDQAVAGTMAAQTQVALSVQQTLAAMVTDTPQFTHTPSLTFTLPFTLTPEMATVTVSVDTNCRTGPGSVYPIVGALTVGQTAQVVGRSPSGDTWIIKLPSNPSITCWLWGQYATGVGDTNGLPVYTPPPTPTLTQTPAPSMVNLTIVNHDWATICYMHIGDETNWALALVVAVSIPTGSSSTFEVISGTYDIMAKDHTDFSTVYFWLDVPLYSDTTLVAP